jgi:hypothetical protein
VVILWDTQGCQGWYADPSQVEGELLYPKNKVTLRFEQADLLTPESLHRLVWNSRSGRRRDPLTIGRLAACLAATAGHVVLIAWGREGVRRPCVTRHAQLHRR